MAHLTGPELLVLAVNVAILAAVPIVAILLFLRLFRKLSAIEEKVDAIRRELNTSR